MKRIKGFIGILLILALMLTAACSSAEVESTSGEGGSDVTFDGGSSVISIISGSENAELEPILERFAEEENVRIEITYKGSLDIMRMLGQEDIPYDVVWPASSLWLSVGDTNHRVKHAESVSVTPVVFGIKQSLAEELGFVGSAGIVILLLLIVIECILTSRRAKDLSGKIICCGVAAVVGFQSFLNICVATGLLPNTGTPLPFVSYGLTSLVSLYIGMGLVLNVGLQNRRYLGGEKNEYRIYRP